MYQRLFKQLRPPKKRELLWLQQKGTKTEGTKSGRLKCKGQVHQAFKEKLATKTKGQGRGKSENKRITKTT